MSPDKSRAPATPGWKFGPQWLSQRCIRICSKARVNAILPSPRSMHLFKTVLRALDWIHCARYCMNWVQWTVWREKADCRWEGKVRYREVNCLAQGHRTGQWQSQELKLVPWLTVQGTSHWTMLIPCPLVYLLLVVQQKSWLTKRSRYVGLNFSNTSFNQKLLCTANALRQHQHTLLIKGTWLSESGRLSELCGMVLYIL